MEIAFYLNYYVLMLKLKNKYDSQTDCSFLTVAHKCFWYWVMQSDDENSALLGGGAENKAQVVSIFKLTVSTSIFLNQ